LSSLFADDGSFAGGSSEQAPSRSNAPPTNVSDPSVRAEKAFRMVASILESKKRTEGLFGGSRENGPAF
jgi:hypothetical protein